MRKMTMAVLAACLSATAVPAWAHHSDEAVQVAAIGPANATILLVRHAEKPADGAGLTPTGQERAAAYVSYFEHLRIAGEPARIDTLVATADSAKSMRPRLTLTPLGKALGLPVQQPFADDDVKDMAAWLTARPGHVTLVAWHHGKLPKLLAHLGADPDRLLPGGTWPDDTYDWVIELRYDGQGHLGSAERIVEPGDLVHAR
jgi:hypothetical protein